MAKNSKKDSAIKVFSIISVILCVGVILLALYLNSTNKNPYDFAKVDTHNIRSSEEILEIGNGIYNDIINLKEDIYINDASYRIGSEEFPFDGVFNGNGHTVYFSYDTATSETSLFSYLSKNAVVKNTNFVFTNIQINDSSFGGIAKINDGTIKDCTVTFDKLEIKSSGVFSPLVTINRGEVTNVLIKTLISKNSELLVEKDVFFGNACVYNGGRISGIIVISNYEGWESTNELNILKGLRKNYAISAISYSIIENGNQNKCVALVEHGTYTSDKVSDVVFNLSTMEVFQEDYIFHTLDFSNISWELTGGILTLKTLG